MTAEQFRELPLPQRKALRRVYLRGETNQAKNFSEFVARATFAIGLGGVVMVPWAGMWLGIELDGYTHS